MNYDRRVTIDIKKSKQREKQPWEGLELLGYYGSANSRFAKSGTGLKWYGKQQATMGSADG